MTSNAPRSGAPERSEVVACSALLDHISRFAAGWFEHALGGGRVLGQFRSRAHWPPYKLAAAVRAFKVEL